MGRGEEEGRKAGEEGRKQGWKEKLKESRQKVEMRFICEQ